MDAPIDNDYFNDYEFYRMRIFFETGVERSDADSFRKYMLEASMKNLTTSELEIMDVIHAKQNRRYFIASKSLQNICLEHILSRKEEICRAADETGINTMEKLAPTLRTSLLEKLSRLKCDGDTEKFQLAGLMMALLVHRATTYVRFPRCNAIQNDFEYLARVTEQIAIKAPKVQRLCFGNRAPKLGDNINLNNRSCFLLQLARLKNLKVLDALAFRCDSGSLEIIASNLKTLTHLRVSLDYINIIDSGQVFLKQLQNLQHFQFAKHPDVITKQEIYVVQMCMRLLPKLKTIGRELKTKLFKHNIFVYYTSNINYCSDDCMSLPLRQLALEEFACHGYFWQANQAHRLPNLKRLHLNGSLQLEGARIPDTVTDLYMYFNSAPWRLDALSSRLRVLYFFFSDLQPTPSGSVLALCPNLEELYLHDCNFYPRNITENVDMHCCKLKKLVISNVAQRTNKWDGLLPILLQAPQLETVQIVMKSVPIADIQQLVEQVRSGRILQRISHFQICEDEYNVRALQLAVQAFCPNVVEVGWIKYKSVQYF